MTDFDWSALPPALLTALARSLRVRAAEAPDALISAYGRVPSSDFVFERWVLLRDAWLSHDSESALRVATGLRELGVGRSETDLADPAAVLDYLHSCRASRAVREVVLPVLLEAGGGEAGAPADPAGSAMRPAGDEDHVLLALARLELDQVPDLVASLARGLELFGEDGDVGEQGAPALVIAALFAITAIGTSPDRVGSSGPAEPMPEVLADAAAAVVAGAKTWAASGDADGLFGALLFAAMMVAADGDPAVDDAFIVSVLDVLGGGPRRTGAGGDMRELVAWATRRYVVSDSAPGGNSAWQSERGSRANQWDPGPQEWTTSRGDGAPGDDPAIRDAAADEPSIWNEELDPVAEEVGEWIDDPGFVDRYRTGVQWLASDVGATALIADEVVTIGDRPVTALRVFTMGHMANALTSRQLSTALSDANLHDGINSIVGGDGVIAVRSALAVHCGNAGWITAPMCIATVASALAALHLPPELRLESAGSSRSEPHWMVANLGGWEVRPDDADNYQLPYLDQMQETIGWLGPFPHKVVRGEHEIALTLPGPNGRLDGRRARRRGVSDDQVLVMSKVTRPPWGAGVKFVLRLPTGYDEASGQDLAVEANLREWDMVPNVVVWGGWSGEAGALRLTSFLPQILMSSNIEASQRLVASFLQYTIRRGEAIAVQLGLA